MKKQCPICKEKKDASGFYKCPTRSGGLRAYCKECQKIKQRLNRKYFREYKRKQRKNKEFRLKECKWNKKTKAEINAYGNLHHAIKKGKIKKKPCIVCKKEGAYAHHEDYLKPLDVIWLCPPHHKQLHTGVLTINKNLNI